MSTFVLLILDGWGHRDSSVYNAISAANTPHWDHYWQDYPHTLISGSGMDVGLPDGQMGNSEVGHMTIGAGRVIYQDLTRIDLAIENGDFFKQPVLVDALTDDHPVHVFILLSPGGVHSHERHLQALIKMAAEQGVEKLYVHAILDGRDMPPKSAAASILLLEQTMKQYGCGQIASLVGRFYAMDRDKRWDRVQVAYELFTEGKAVFHAKTALEGLEQAYARGETDEFVQPTSILPATIELDDTVIFMNFRSDRARELTRAFTDKNFDGFPRKRPAHTGNFITLTPYAADIKLPTVFEQQKLDNTLGAYLAQLGLHQLRIAETEKYAHVTFFFNGGLETPYPGEERELIASPKVATYDLQPEMSAPALTDELVAAIRSQKYDLIVCNYANPDMVGHTGNFEATVRAIEVIDQCLGLIVETLQQVGGEVIITADHGNAEYMYDEKTNQAHTAHTSSLVPLIYIGRPAIVNAIPGALSDIAPTLLYLKGLSQPKEMTGHSLLTLLEET